MRCEEAAEFVSMLCDGEVIPREAAEHIGGCDACRVLLQTYTAMGVELRREASVVMMDEVPALRWEPRTRWWGDMWKKGWGYMRVPRLVFAGMLAGIVVLGSGLVVVRARTRSVGDVLLVKITPAGQQSFECALSTVDKKENVCAIIGNHLGIRVQAVSKDGEFANLAIRTISKSSQDGKAGLGSADLDNVPDEAYQLEPGNPLHINASGFGDVEITGSWIDHIPAMIGEGENYDPKLNEVRILSPLLLRDKQVAGDMEGGSAISDQLGQYVAFYVPGDGRYEFSLSPLPDGVQAKVNSNRISFEQGGDSYVLVTGAPITRAKQIWARRDTAYKPPADLADGYIGVSDLSDLKKQVN